MVVSMTVDFWDDDAKMQYLIHYALPVKDFKNGHKLPTGQRYALPIVRE